MSPRKPVESLRSIALNKFEIFFQKIVEDKSREIVKLDRSELEHQIKHRRDENSYFVVEKTDFRSEAIDHYVTLLRSFIFDQVVYSLVEDVVQKILSAIKVACERRRQTWKMEDDSNGRFADEMMTIVDFTQVIVTPQLRQLDLSEVVKILRSRIFDLLPRFTGLFTLKCGSGSGGVSDIYGNKFLSAVRNLKLLVHFSLQYDCNDEIITVLKRNCKNSLRILDVEYSTRVTDKSVSNILQCSKIVQLHLFRTGMTSRGHAELLKGLKSLRLLVRGDFLCEALEILKEETGDQIPLLAIEEFWASEDYYFHDVQQMSLVARTCPRMRKIMFQFNAEFAKDFLVLAPFRNLTELHNWGGDFYTDRFNELISLIGHRLKVLYFIHVDEMDWTCLGLISRVCNQLQTLGFYNCIFPQDEHQPQQQQANQQNVVKSDSTLQLEPMLDLQRLAIVSSCGTDYAVGMVGAALNVRYLIFGLSTDFSESCVKRILAKNRLSKLEELKVSKSSDLSIGTIYGLVEICPNLRSIRDMEYWTGISEEELAKFRFFIFHENYDVLTEDPSQPKLSIPRGDVGRTATGYWSRRLHALQAE